MMGYVTSSPGISESESQALASPDLAVLSHARQGRAAPCLASLDHLRRAPATSALVPQARASLALVPRDRALLALVSPDRALPGLAAPGPVPHPDAPSAPSQLVLSSSAAEHQRGPWSSRRIQPFPWREVRSPDPEGARSRVSLHRGGVTCDRRCAFGRMGTSFCVSESSGRNLPRIGHAFRSDAPPRRSRPTLVTEAGEHELRGWLARSRVGDALGRRALATARVHHQHGDVGGRDAGDA
jgi:hypothetical protein